MPIAGDGALSLRSHAGDYGTLCEAFQAAVAARGDARALVDAQSGEQWSWAEAGRDVHRIAGGRLRTGRPGGLHGDPSGVGVGLDVGRSGAEPGGVARVADPAEGHVRVVAQGLVVDVGGAGGNARSAADRGRRREVQIQGARYTAQQQKTFKQQENAALDKRRSARRAGVDYLAP
jgi:hypothetical protein